MSAAERRYVPLNPAHAPARNGWNDDNAPRSAIIAALERLALSILSQIVDAVVPDEHPVDCLCCASPGQCAGQCADPAPSWCKIDVLLARRKCRDDSGLNAGHALRRKTQRLQFPRRYGSGETVRSGARELASLLRMMELILDGLKEDKVSTKRDLFYRDVRLFITQKAVDTITDDLAATLHVRRSELNVIASGKGLFAGALKLVLKDGSEICSGEHGALIPPDFRIANVECAAVAWILVVEKDAAFNTLVTSSLLRDAELGHGILLTGKGYPDLATRELLKRLSDLLPATSIFALVDSDPHGLAILSIYAHGSVSQAHDAANLVVPRVRWLGIKGTEWDRLGIDRDELLPLTKADRSKALSMLRRGGLPHDWSRELEYMLHSNRKAEVQILSSTPGDLRMRQSRDIRDRPELQQRAAASRLVDYIKRSIGLALEEPGKQGGRRTPDVA